MKVFGPRAVSVVLLRRSCVFAAIDAAVRWGKQPPESCRQEQATTFESWPMLRASEESATPAVGPPRVSSSKLALAASVGRDGFPVFPLLLHEPPPVKLHGLNRSRLFCRQLPHCCGV